ncbi:MAG: uracil-DNA glycosylase family protein [bacterium]
MEKLDKEKIHLISDFNLKKLQDEELNILENQKQSYIIDNKGHPKLFRWPGFTFTSEKAMKSYKKIHDRFIQENIYVPPRGNLSIKSNYIFIGIKPGMSHPDITKGNMAFLGPSGRILYKLLTKENIYPYITNVFKSPYSDGERNFEFIIKELLVIFYIFEKIYKKNNLNLVFLGSYEDYSTLVGKLAESKSFNENFNIQLKCFSIWHPAYLVRNFNEYKFQEWKTQLKNENRMVGKGIINKKENKSKNLL